MSDVEIQLSNLDDGLMDLGDEVAKLKKRLAVMEFLLCSCLRGKTVEFKAYSTPGFVEIGVVIQASDDGDVKLAVNGEDRWMDITRIRKVL